MPKGFLSRLGIRTAPHLKRAALWKEVDVNKEKTTRIRCFSDHENIVTTLWVRGLNCTLRRLFCFTLRVSFRKQLTPPLVHGYPEGCVDVHSRCVLSLVSIIRNIFFFISLVSHLSSQWGTKKCHYFLMVANALQCIHKQSAYVKPSIYFHRNLFLILFYYFYVCMVNIAELPKPA